MSDLLFADTQCLFGELLTKSDKVRVIVGRHDTCDEKFRHRQTVFLEHLIDFYAKIFGNLVDSFVYLKNVDSVFLDRPGKERLDLGDNQRLKVADGRFDAVSLADGVAVLRTVLIITENLLLGKRAGGSDNLKDEFSRIDDTQVTLTDCTSIDAEIESLLEEISVVTELTKRCIAENSQTVQNQIEYAARYNGFVERYEKAKEQLEQLRTTKAERDAQAEAIGAFMFEVQELDALSEFDEKLWRSVIDTVTVHADGRLTFKFQGGTEIDA